MNVLARDRQIGKNIPAELRSSHRGIHPCTACASFCNSIRPISLQLLHFILFWIARRNIRHDRIHRRIG